MAAQSLTSQARFVAFRASLAGRSLVRQLLQSSLMRWRYRGPPIDRLLLVPQDLRTADPSFASEIYHGHFGLAGAIAAIGNESPFAIVPPNAGWARELHGFGWLRHLRAADDHISREHARALVRDWIELHGTIDGLPWRSEVVARRLISWLSQAPVLLEGANEEFFELVMSSLARQMRYLRASYSKAPDGAPRLLCLIALVLAGLCAASEPNYVSEHGVPLQTELERQILADGGHVSRDPGALIELLLDFLPLRQCFVARDLKPPQALIAAIDRMMPMVRFFRMGDGQLAHFNGMGWTQTDGLATALAYDDAQGKPLVHAVPSGYCRLARGDLILLADVGAAPPLAVSRAAHGGCLAFELSAGADLIVVNCGSPAAAAEDWRQPSRSTAAHSTVIVADTSSSQMVPTSADGSLVDAGLLGPDAVECQIVEEDGGIALRAYHDGYRARYGIIHERRLRVSAAGDSVRGVDRLHAPRGLQGAAKRGDGAFDIRFHLHPSVRAQLSQDGRTALLVTGSRRGWRIVSDGAPMTMEESVYLADIAGPRRTLQVVLSGAFDGGNEVRVGWAIEASAAVPVDAIVARDAVHEADELPLE